MKRKECLSQHKMRKIFTVKPLLRPPPPSPRGLFISSPFKRGLTEMGGLFNLEITMVSVLHKELEYKDIVEKLKYKNF